MNTSEKSAFAPASIAAGGGELIVKSAAGPLIATAPAPPRSRAQEPWFTMVKVTGDPATETVLLPNS